MKSKEIDTGTPNLWPLLPKDPPILSPRFHWRQAHGIVVSYHPNRERKNEWRATLGLAHVFADTADEAETAICEKMNLAHWRINAGQQNQQ
jgi:hypothetical protein